MTEQIQGGVPRTINVTLHPDGVAGPAHRAAIIRREAVDLYFDALSKTDLDQPPQVDQRTSDCRPVGQKHNLFRLTRFGEPSHLIAAG